jgi:hypothetical protein
MGVRLSAEMSVYLPYLSSLNELIQTTVELEAAIANVANSASITSAVYEDLQTRVNACAMKVSNAHLLDAVGQRMHFMENFESVIDKDRIEIETINQLMELASDLLANTGSMDVEDESESVLSKSLETNIVTAQSRMAKLKAEVAKTSELAKPSILEGRVDENMLQRLKASRVISEEEYVMEFFKVGI